MASAVKAVVANARFAKGRSRLPGQSVHVLGAAFVAAFTGVAYELLLAAYATYLWGATVFQYSAVLSLMMLSMGVGTLFAKRFSSPAVAFLATETLLALLALLALPVLYTLFYASAFARVSLFAFVVLIGGLVGMEIPLLSRLTERLQKRADISVLLFFDYLGGFAGGLLFPILLVPELGFFAVSGLLAALNACVAVMMAVRLRGELGRNWGAWLVGTTVMALVSVWATANAGWTRERLEARYLVVPP